MEITKASQESLYCFIPRGDFINPKHEKAPVEISEFLKELDLSTIENLVLRNYKNDYHSRFPPMAMTKSIILMRHKKIKSFPKLADYLIVNKECAANLGFDTKKPMPSKKTLWHFATKRLKPSWKSIIDKTIQEVVLRLRSYGIEIGKEIAVDATPIEALQNDKEAIYNGHYKLLMYKLYTAVDVHYRIPLAYAVDEGTASDSGNLIPLLYQVKQKGIDFDYVYADGAFESHSNFAEIHMRFSANFRTNLGEYYTLSEEGSRESIEWHYERSWNKAPHYRSLRTINNDIDYMMMVLVDIGETHAVGNYYRNTLIREVEEAPAEYEEQYKSARTRIEEFHGHIKEQLEIEHKLNRKGLENVRQYLEMCLFSYLCVALNRLQHGVTDGLVDLSGLV